MAWQHAYMPTPEETTRRDAYTIPEKADRINFTPARFITRVEDKEEILARREIPVRGQKVILERVRVCSISWDEDQETGERVRERRSEKNLLRLIFLGGQVRLVEVKDGWLYAAALYDGEVAEYLRALGFSPARPGGDIYRARAKR